MRTFLRVGQNDAGIWLMQARDEAPNKKCHKYNITEII